jgi:hypothetical protein
LCTFAHGDTEIRTKNQNNMSGMLGPNQGMPMMNQFMPGYFPPMDPNAMYGMGMGMGMGMPNQGGYPGGK